MRFWHHTIQEYFYAREQRRVLSFPGPLSRRWRVRRELARRADEDALTFLPVHVTDREIGAFMRVATRVNITLAARWADDLAIDGRAGDSVRFFLRAAEKRLRTTRLYSRVTYERRPVMAGALLAPSHEQI